MRDARLLLHADAVVGALAEAKKRLPRDPGGMLDPGFFRAGIAAGDLALLEHVAARAPQACVDLAQLAFAFHLNAEVVEACRPAARRNGKIDARIIQHPFAIVGLHYGGEERRKPPKKTHGVAADLAPHLAS